MTESIDYKRGWYDGFMEALKKNTTIYPNPPFVDWTKHQLPATTGPFPPTMNQNRCYVCGIEFKNATHYVCNNIGCPTKVTCTAAGTAGKYDYGNLADNNMSALNPEILTTININKDKL